MLTTILLLIFGLLINESTENCLTPNDNRQPNPNGAKGLYTGQQEFSLAMLQAINKLNPNENLFFSPYSTYHALLIAYFISGRSTEQYLRKTLRLDANHVSHFYLLILIIYHRTKKNEPSN